METATIVGPILQQCTQHKAYAGSVLNLPNVFAVDELIILMPAWIAHHIDTPLSLPCVNHLPRGDCSNNKVR